MTRKQQIYLILAAAVVLSLTACTAGPNNVAEINAPRIAGFWLGLWHGLWHGLISPITFVVSLFTSEVSVYDVHNNGNWYDTGFILGVASAFSGAGRAGAGAAPKGRASRRRG